MEAAWKGILTEAERLSDVHLQVKENLCCGEIKQIKTWQKENYHKVITPINARLHPSAQCARILMHPFSRLIHLQNMIQIKERKEMEDLFKKAQKPWAKHLVKVEKTKADYHAACKTEKTVSNQERNASSDSSLSPDQVRVLDCFARMLYTGQACAVTSLSLSRV